MLNVSPPPSPVSVLLPVSIFPEEAIVPRELKCPGLNFQATKIVILGIEPRLSESYSVLRQQNKQERWCVMEV